MHFTKESIFLSSIRSLCNALGAILGIFIAFLLAVFAISGLSNPEVLPEKSAMSIAPDANGQRKMVPPHSPVVLKINNEGVIGLGKLTYENIQNILFDSREDMLGKNRVQAILLYVNTPGGEATNSVNIYEALLDYKKKYNVPIYAFVDGLCASGGMWICSAADKIYASPTSVIGSVGVRLGTNFNFTDLMSKVGIQSLTITEGKDKDALNPFRPWQPGEYASLINITKDLYELFVDVVTAARPNLNKEKLIQEYGAHVFLAKTAQNLGYIDVSDANYFQTLQALTAASTIQEQEYQVIELSRPESFFAQLAQNKLSLFSGKVEHSLQVNPAASAEFSGKLLCLYQP